MSTVNRAPLIVERPRTAEAIAERIDARHVAAGFAPRGEDGLRDALVRIGALFGEILVERLNDAPVRHAEAFLAGAAGPAQPPCAAEVLLSFTPVLPARPTAAAAIPIVVPAGTVVAAPPAAGEAEPVLFETVADLPVTRARAEQALLFDARRLMRAPLDGLLSPAGLANGDMAAQAQPFMFLTHVDAAEVLRAEPLARVGIELELAGPGRRPADAVVEWGWFGPEGFVALAVLSDSTQALSHSGRIELEAPPAWPAATPGGVESLWLSCRLVHGGRGLSADTGFVPPIIAQIGVFADMQLRAGPPTGVAHGSVLLDASRDFFPFGERPRFGDVFHLAAPVFSQPGARIRLDVEMTNPAGRLDGPLPPVRGEGRPRVRWEAHTARGWVEVEADDGTGGFISSGVVAFGMPLDAVPATIAGQSGAWVRARLVSGHYGAPQVVDGVSYPVAPCIAVLRVDAQARLGPLPPRRLLREGVLGAQMLDPMPPGAFELFAAPDAPGAALYLALQLLEPDRRTRTISLQVQPADRVGRPVLRSAPAASAGPRWQWKDAQGWHDCQTDDESSGLREAGLVHLRWDGADETSPRRLWLRALWPPSAEPPALRRIALNAVRAWQLTSIENEILGSSTGRPGQLFRARRTPIVGEVVLQVREGEQWVRWDRVQDLADADATSRCFTFEPVSGRIAFGDGRCGRIPPAAANNLRLGRYRVGGGRRGNQGANAVAQLRTTVPYVDAVTNLEPAAGGQDAPDAAARLAAASARLRHRDRAICRDDYADLALASAPEVARAYCLPACDPAAGRWTAAQAAGTVSVVVVPLSEDPRPQPTQALLERVRGHLDARRPLAAELVVLGPAYAAVSVQAQVDVEPGESPLAVADACRLGLQRHLHPLHGGSAGAGWQPGERPHRSDLVALLGAVDGVRQVLFLKMRIEEPAEGPETAWPAGGAEALVCCGDVELSA